MIGAGLAVFAHLALTTAARGAFERFDLRPFPTVVVRDTADMQRGEIARAVLYESGREEVWVSRSAVDSPSLGDAMDHESAHLRAYRDYGPKIAEHGREWRRTCRAHAQHPGKACRSTW